MKISKKTRTGIIIATLFFLFFNVLVILKNQNSKDNSAPQEQQADTTAVTYTPFPEQWKYHAGDDTAWATPGFNDSLWESTSPVLDLDSLPSSFFTGICWFRTSFSINEKYVNKLVGLSFNHYGASQIYLDGKEIKHFGKLSSNKEQEEGLMPEVPVLFSVSDTNRHVLAIRYSNHSAYDYYSQYKEEQAGIKLKFIANPDEIFTERVNTNRFLLVFVLLFGFFITLSIVHFLLFIFYRKQKQNLYYSLFVFIFSLMIVTPYVLYNTSTPSLNLKIEHYYIIPTIFLLPSIVACLYSLFKPPHAKLLFAIELILAILSWGVNYIDFLVPFNESIFFAFILFTSIESIRTIVIAVIQKKPGAKIIGTGVIIFFLFIVTLIILAFINSHTSMVLNGDSALFYIILIILCIISIPLSMSIYLANDFASTNRNLSAKLEEVESLSVKSIAQEKEKQAILSSQKENLEIQVKERTIEITKQKHEIEEKNKEITDSINYAQKIQHTLMASDKLLSDNLRTAGTSKDYFILYKPKDIVSGDYYWAYKPEQENSFLLITADCTGHGVPGAFMSLLCISYLNETVKEQRVTRPDKIFNLVRDKIVSNFTSNENAERKDGMDAVIYKLNYDTGTLEYSAANNPVILLEPGENNSFEIIELKADKMSVGVTHDGVYKPFAYGSHQLKPGTLIYTFTDGYADQFGGPKGKKFMYKQMRELFLQIAPLPLHEQQAKLTAAIEDWKQGTEQVDDILIVGVKF